MNHDLLSQPLVDYFEAPACTECDADVAYPQYLIAVDEEAGNDFAHWLANHASAEREFHGLGV